MRKTQEAEVDVKTNELIVEVIAGPETANRLGVPVGTVVDARYCVTPVGGLEKGAVESRIISPLRAAKLKQLFGRKGENS